MEAIERMAMSSRFHAAALMLLLLLAPFSGIVGADENEPARSCEILVDWDSEWSADDASNWSYKVIQRYVVEFDPVFVNGTSPSAVSVNVEHLRDGSVIGSQANASIIVAGGSIDVILADEPEFLDEVTIGVETSEASCSRRLQMTLWNQPTADHEITRETTWELDSEAEGGSSLFFEGRGWQKRSGTELTASELGNGSLILDLDTGGEQTYLSLELDRVWLNETYDGTELIRQDFEMHGTGSLLFDSTSGESNISIEANVYDAYILRSWENGIMTERLRLEANGQLTFDGGSNNSSTGGFGELSVFYFETWDENGIRRLSDRQIEAAMTLRIQSGEDSFSFELDEFKIRERWLDGIREEQMFKIKGSGEFGFVVREDQFHIVVNGTIANLHIEQSGGETVADTLHLDGHYSGDASGSFGITRHIEKSELEDNSEGEKFEVDVIRNEFWFNISAIPIGPIGDDFNAEHNLTFEYTVPQTDWENRTIRYQYIEDNGTVEDEYPENSPIRQVAQRPESTSEISASGFREAGVVPDELVVGDVFPMGRAGIGGFVHVTGISLAIADGHEVEVAEWSIDSDGVGFNASGKVINEGILAGLLYEAERIFEIDLSNAEENITNVIRIAEHQTLERVLYPSVITAEGNTPPALTSLGFREGALFTEGGIAHLQAVVEDVDTDTIAVAVDLSSFGLGIIPLSDTGLLGDEVIHDSVWTARIEHTGLEFGVEEVSIKMDDLWVDVETTASLEISNAAPRIVSRIFTPDTVYRGQMVDVQIRAEDGHGVASVGIDLLSAGGELSALTLDSGTGMWIGSFTVPDSLAPGRRTIPIQVSDAQGASALLDAGAFLDILNEAPSVSNISFIKSGEWSAQITIPTTGQATYLMEVVIHDPDGVSSVQAKLGRLAPIGKAETWLLLVDDGTAGDRLADDGIYTLELSIRSSLTAGEMNFLVRGADIFQSITPTESQIHSIELVEGTDEGGGGPSWLAQNSMAIILVTLFLLLALGATAVVITMRNSDLE